MNDVTTTFSITLSMDDLAALLARSMNQPIEASPLVAVAEMAPPAANPPATRSHRATRAAQQANGQASPAQEPAAADAAPTLSPAPAAASALQIPPEEELRPLLSKMAAVHHDKVLGVTTMLEKVGGHKRLAECPPDTWPAIKQACVDAIAAAGG